MSDIGIAFMGGMLAFAHCLGMCGGFALHLAQGPGRLGGLGRQLLWQGGKTFTYVFLGALAGFAGGLVRDMRQFPWVQNSLAYIAGGAMILMGLSLLGVLPKRAKAEGAAGEGFLSHLFGQFFGKPSGRSSLVLGLSTGFLPCPIVLAGLAFSAERGSVLKGMGIMAALGAGTAWSLLLLGMTGQFIRLGLRRWGAAAAGIVLVLLGATTVLRGTEVYHRVLGCPETPAGTAEAGTGACCHEMEKAADSGGPCPYCAAAAASQPATMP